MSFWPRWSENKPFSLVLIILLAYLGVFMLVKTNHLSEQTQRLDRPEPREFTITVDGEAELNSVPDLATVRLTVETKGLEVAGAQEENTKITNKLIAQLKELGIKKEDLQTSSYDIHENREWNQEIRKYEHVGWAVSQLLTVKVRDMEKVSDVFAVAGKNGVTNVSGPDFTIDDPTALRDQARREAIADAHEKAAELASALGVKLVRVIGFNESTGGYPPPMPYYYMKAEGIGGGDVAAAPAIEPGSQDVKINVSVTYLLE